MRRIITVLLLVFVLSCSAAGVYASTDCERWVAQYKQALLQKRQVQRLRAAKRRLQRKLAGIVIHRVAKPGPRRVALHPRMSPMEALKRFELDCGELVSPPKPNVPIDITGTPAFGLLPPENMPPLETAMVEFPSSPTPVMTPALPPGAVPSFTPVGSAPPGYPGYPVPVPAPPGLGGGPLPTIPTTPTLPSPVPEPSSIVLVVTGVGGAVALARRRATIARQMAVRVAV